MFFYNSGPPVCRAVDHSRFSRDRLFCLDHRYASSINMPTTLQYLFYRISLSRLCCVAAAPLSISLLLSIYFYVPSLDTADRTFNGTLLFPSPYLAVLSLNKLKKKKIK